MLSKKYRLTKRGSFSYVYRVGKSVHSSLFKLALVPAKDCTRIGFSVSNKVGNAVNRNLLRRRMRAVVSPLVKDLKACQAVFIAKPVASCATYKKIEEEILYLLKTSGLYLPNNEKEE